MEDISVNGSNRSFNMPRIKCQGKKKCLQQCSEWKSMEKVLFVMAVGNVKKTRCNQNEHYEQKF